MGSKANSAIPTLAVVSGSESMKASDSSRIVCAAAWAALNRSPTDLSG